MKVKMKNSSSLKTREKIKSAFAKEVKIKKDVDKITVTDITKLADITRGTFYTHYDNIYDVAKEFQDETLNVLTSNLSKLQTAENIDLFFDTVMNYLEKHEDIYAMLLSSNDPFLFTGNLNKLILDNLAAVLPKEKIKSHEMAISIYLDGSIALIIKYFRKEIPYSLEEINQVIKETFKKLF